MNEETRKTEQAVEGCWGSASRQRIPQAIAPGVCPMSEMCTRFTGSMPMGLFLAFGGIVLIGLGVLVVAEPRALTWLMSGLVIVLGVAALVGALVTRRLRAGPNRP